MRKVSRREFLGTSLVAGCLTAGPNRIEASPLGIPLGFQAYGIRDRIGADLAGSLRAAKEIGYEAVELCSFKGYARSGFGPLADMKTADIRKVLQDVGVKAPSCHFQFSEFDGPVIDQSIEWATGVGLKFMTLSMAKRATTMDQWKQNFDLMNKYGQKVQKAGLIFGYHTHSDEWKKIDGVMVFDEMLRQVDKKHCMYQLDLGGTFANDLDAGKYMAAHPGRFFSLHLKDAKKQPPEPAPPAAAEESKAGPGRGRGMGNTPPVLPVGQGDINWKETFAGAKKGGVTTYFVEMEVRPPTDPMEAMKLSAQYLRNLKV
jgi:sugar phosphate isomerase/epimerase